MKKQVKRLGSGAFRILMFVVCGFLSAFLLMSGFESAYSRSLPLVHTVDPVNLQAYSDSYDLAAAGRNNPDLYGDFGKPENIKLPERAARLDIGPALHDGSSWLARSNVLHLMIPAETRQGNIGIALLYCRSSFRTINLQNAPTVGSNIFMDTEEEWRYVYKVSSVKTYSDKTPYIVSDSGQNSKLIISCNDPAAGLNIVVEANLLSVQGIE